jgi:hypothetical protein
MVAHRHSGSARSFGGLLNHRIWGPAEISQNWGDKQHPHHTNWADLFFDLIYVGAAYNIGNMLKANVSGEGVGVFLVLYLTLANCWYSKTSYSSRIKTTDIGHMASDVLDVLCIAMAALHVRPKSEVLADNSFITFGLSVALALTSLVQALLWHEVSVCNQGPYDPGVLNKFGIKAAANAVPFARGNKRVSFEGCLFFAAAAIVAFPGALDAAIPGGTTGRAPIAMALLICPYLRHIIPAAYRAFKRTDVGAGAGDRRALFEASFVPIHVEYFVHRFAEWTMLMFGEGVLSLLVVDFVYSRYYYMTFAFGFVTMFGLQYLYFDSQVRAQRPPSLSPLIRPHHCSQQLHPHGRVVTALAHTRQLALLLTRSLLPTCSLHRRSSSRTSTPSVATGRLASCFWWSLSGIRRQWSLLG